MTHTEHALAILHEWVQSESLRKHCYAVSDSMAHMAAHYGEDPDLWAAVGLLHDMDFERYPQMPPEGEEPVRAAEVLLGDVPAQPPMEMHPFVGVTHLRQNGWDRTVARAILSHADYSGVSRDSLMEKTLAAVDELSGFVMAVALVRPSKSVHEVEIPAVRKKMKDKAFARAVSREEITHNAEALGMPLEALISHVIMALRGDAARLGIAGTAA